MKDTTMTDIDDIFDDEEDRAQFVRPIPSRKADMTETTARTRQPFDVRLTDRGADIWSGPTDNDIIFGTVYDKGPGSYDHEEMAKVWAAAYTVMFPALANIRNVARRAAETDRYETKEALLTLLAAIAKAAGDALPGPTIGDLMNGATPPALSASPAAPSPAPQEALTTCVTCQGFGTRAHSDDPCPIPCPDCFGTGAVSATPAAGEALTEALIKAAECLKAHANYWRHAIYPTDFRPLRDQLFDTIGTVRAALAAARKEG